MIAINEDFLFTEEHIDYIIEEMRKASYNKNTERACQVFYNFLKDFYKYDQKLTKMVQDNLGEDLYPIVTVETSPISNPNEFHFMLASTDENRELSKRDERKFYEYCDICFGAVEGLFDRFLVEFEKE